MYKNTLQTLVFINNRTILYNTIPSFMLSHISDFKSDHPAYSAPPAHVHLQTDSL